MDIGPIRKDLLDRAKAYVGGLMVDVGRNLNTASSLLGGGVRAATGITEDEIPAAPDWMLPGNLSGLTSGGEALIDSSNGLPLARMDRGLMSLQVDPRAVDAAGWLAPGVVHVGRAAAGATKQAARAFGEGIVASAPHMVGGRNAKTADLVKLAEAEKLDERLTVGGEITPERKREYIFGKTGWWKGKDGKWRFEFSDKDATLAGTLPKEGDWGVGELGDALQHERGYAAYPSARYAALNAKVTPGKKRAGSFSPSKDLIEMQAPDADLMRKGLLHEFQHRIDDAEGFAPGGNPADTEERIRRTLQNDQHLSPENQLPLNDFLMLSQLQETPVRAYQSLAGEAGARAVERRSLLSDAELAQTPFWESFDIPESQQIILTGERDQPVRVNLRPDQLLRAASSSSQLDQAAPTVVNVGLKVGRTGEDVPPETVRAALKRRGVEIIDEDIRASDTEPTLVARLSRPLTPDEANSVAEELQQMAIAQRVGTEGALYGPQAAEWGDFNPEFFLDLPGSIQAADAGGVVPPKVSSRGVQSKTRKKAEAAARESGGQVKRADLVDNSYEVGQRRALVRSLLDKEPRAIDLEALRASSLLDRGLIADAMHGHPGVAQTDPVRAGAKTRKSQADVDARIDTVFNGQNRDLLHRQIMRGQQMGGATYYPSTYPIRVRMDEIGESFPDFVHAHAGTSPQNKLPNNFASQSLVMHAKAQGITDPEQVLELGRAIASRKGHQNFFLSSGHVRNVDELASGAMTGVEKGQKVWSYDQNLLGNFKPKTLDTHEAAGASIGTRLFPHYQRAGGFQSPEYGAFEQAYIKLGDALGISQGAVQPGRWYGGGELTGLATDPGDFLSTLEHMIRYTAELEGIPGDKASLKALMDDFLRGAVTLRPYYGRGLPPLKGGKQGGSIQTELAAALGLAGAGAAGAGLLATKKESE